MPNIFDGFRKISDNDIIEQVALLEIINITNISKPIAQKAKKKTISIINFLGNKFGKNRIIEEPEVTDIWELIDEKKDELKNCTREELDQRLFNILVEKSKSDTEDPAEDAISMQIIDEAAKLYKFYENSTPSQKADNIYLKYNEKFGGKAKEFINEQPFVDLQETTESIEEIINNMDEEQRKEFVQSVDIKELTLLNVWKKLDRQHFARLVWLSVKACGGRFTPKEEILPSFIKNEKEAEIIRVDEELKESQKELLEVKNQMELCKDKINSIENSLKEKSYLLNKAIKSKNQSEEDIMDLQKINVRLQEVKKSQEVKAEEIKGKMESAALEELDLLMEEFKKVKFDTIDINNKISDINIELTYKNEQIKDVTLEIANTEKSIQEVGDEFQHLKVETDKLIRTYDAKGKEVHKIEGIKRNEIIEGWSKFFDKFIFDFKELNNLVNFSRKELLQIEGCLYELHLAKDPMALSMGILEDENNKKDEYQYIDVSFSDNFQVEIQYKVLDNKEKNVHIIEITTEF
ncbi:hypothetical protein [Clostridium sp.]|uniref:hypothetical protein n=1 Tax=Clostridium sp. TaxID=1506 RepID=UPI0028471AD3|nr:hypothetical protein [Clostridium sp.]MDR3595290.1 hypothetical protein [Clostridium sp.]